MAFKIALVGVGTIGRSWAITFAHAGYDVALYDQNETARTEAPLHIAAAVNCLEAAGLMDAADEVLGRISVEASMDRAVSSAVYVQESVAENVDIKCAVFKEIAQYAPDDAILASSASEIPGSEFLADISNRERCLVVHPINPPHVVPLVEICPTPYTSEQTKKTTFELMRKIGQKPILVKKEIIGFIANRLQFALINEALHLVGEGYVSPEDADKAIKFGLGLRWAFMGPFETGYLNAPGGYREYMNTFGDNIRDLIKGLCVNYQWAPKLIDQIHESLEPIIPLDTIAGKQLERDVCVLELREHLAATAQERKA